MSASNGWENPTGYANQQMPFPGQQNPWGNAGSMPVNPFEQDQNQIPFPAQASAWDSLLGNNNGGIGTQNNPNAFAAPDWNNPGQPFQSSTATLPESDQNGQWGQDPSNGPPDSGSLLPVPYQGGVAPGQELMVLPQGQGQGGNGALVPYDSSMLPALPDEGPVYVPPMYTKPRPIIPRYRAISGLISTIVVVVLLCTGATYLAKVTGQLNFLGVLFGDVRPASVQSPANSNIPDPKQNPEIGPANAIINSATTASVVDQQHYIPIQPAQIFKPGQTIYLTYTVHPKGKGVVTIKWYTNNILYRSYSDTITGSINAIAHQAFQAPVEGKVELYWNNQLAIGYYFAVR